MHLHSCSDGILSIGNSRGPVGGHQPILGQRQLVGVVIMADKAVADVGREGHLGPVIVYTVVSVTDMLIIRGPYASAEWMP